jgi:anti-sigma-K factor RskA
MQLHPSTQSCRVICVRDGKSLSSASEKLRGRSTSPPTGPVVFVGIVNAV